MIIACGISLLRRLAVCLVWISLAGCASYNYMQAPVYVPRPSYEQSTVLGQGSFAASASGFVQAAGRATLADKHGWMVGLEGSYYGRVREDSLVISAAPVGNGRSNQVQDFTVRGYSLGLVGGRAWFVSRQTLMVIAGLAHETQHRSLIKYGGWDEARYRAQNTTQRVWLQGAVRTCVRGYDNPMAKQLYVVWGLRAAYLLPGNVKEINVSLTDGPLVREPYALRRPDAAWQGSMIGGLEYRCQRFSFGYQLQINVSEGGAYGWYHGPNLAHTLQAGYVVPWEQ